MTPQHPAPGADQDRVILRAQMAQLETLIRERTSSAWCTAHWRVRPCGCFKCSALRLCRYALT